jgi:hypothetical protein
VEHVREPFEDREKSADGREHDKEPVTEEFRNQDPEFSVLRSKIRAVHHDPLPEKELFRGLTARICDVFG